MERKRKGEKTDEKGEKAAVKFDINVTCDTRITLKHH